MGRGRKRTSESDGMRSTSIVMTHDVDQRLDDLCVKWGSSHVPLSRSEVIRRLVLSQECDSVEVVDIQLMQAEERERRLANELLAVKAEKAELVVKKKRITQTRIAEDEKEKSAREGQISKIVDEIVGNRDPLKTYTTADYEKSISHYDTASLGITKAELLDAVQKAMEEALEADSKIPLIERYVAAVKRKRGLYPSIEKAKLHVHCRSVEPALLNLGLNPDEVAEHLVVAR